MDQVFISDLLVRGIIGCRDWERKTLQDILINVILFTDLRPAAKSDELHHCIDWSLLAKRIKSHVEKANKKTVESLAVDVINLCLEDSRVKKVRVKVEKPGAVTGSSIGSNIEPQKNIIKAVSLLKRKCEIRTVSSVWESISVGYDGPNFMNACMIVSSSLSPEEFTKTIIRSIESQLGRVRTSNKNSPRTVDIDIERYGNHSFSGDSLRYAHVLVPMSELLPSYTHPATGRSLAEEAAEARRNVWISRRKDVRISADD